MIWAPVFLCVLLLNLAALSRVRLTSLTFLDGIIIGMVYHLTIPMIFIMLYGKNSTSDLSIRNYYPYEDHITTAIILGFIAAISYVRLAIQPSQKVPFGKVEARQMGIVIIGLYAITAPITFLASGILSGGHWAHATGEMMGSNPAFFVLKFLASITRLLAFPALVALYVAFPEKKKTLVLIGAAVCLFDVLTTFNRITFLYYFLFLIVVFRKNILALLGVCTMVVIGGTLIAPIFGMFRSLVSQYGYSSQGFAYAWQIARENQDNGTLVIDQINGIFESVNITVLNYIIYNYDKVSQPFGTYFFRPLTIFLPRSLFPDRPGVFGGEVGEAILGNRVYVALNSTLLGEPYASSWIFWPAFLAIMIAGYTIYYHWLSRTNGVFQCLGAFVAISMWRFDSSFAASSAAFCLFVSIGLLIYNDYRAKHLNTVANIARLRHREAQQTPAERRKARAEANLGQTPRNIR